MGGYSYGNWARSPEEVQRQNGVKTDFDAAIKRYESIKPLRGKRSKLDVRPIGERNRAYERIVKVSDTEYYLSCTSWGYYEREGVKPEDADKKRAITLKREGEVESIIIHKARYGMTSSSIYWFYDCNLPQGMNMEKYRGSNYVRVLKEDGKFNYYRADKMDITFYRPKGSHYWTALHVYREVKHSLDRKLTKAIREKLTTFTNYARVMLPLVEAKHNYRATLDAHWEDFVTLKNPDEIPESWLTAVAHYAYRLNKYDWTTRTHTINEAGLIPMIQREAYKLAQPFKVEPVPLGELSFDRYKGWV